MKYYQIIGYKNNKLVFQSRLISNYERITETRYNLTKEFSEIFLVYSLL